MRKILVTGSNSQLGKCLRELSQFKNNQLSYDFLTRDELDITNQEAVQKLFKKNNYNYCINCAAYTAVDKAEEEKEKAFNVNVKGVKNLATACKLFKVILFHISTDFVFDGKKTSPYIELDTPNPISVYGKTKLKGEKEIISNMSNYFIIRTSWLYSEYGTNFVKTMLNLSKNHRELNVVNDQIGTPTYAKDLTRIIFHMININSIDYGIYNYSNEGHASWFDFAKAIFEENNISIKVMPIKSEAYPTLAKRPMYSVIDKTKIKKVLKTEIPNWRDSLKTMFNYYNQEL